jgi:hypothetical protein
MIKMERSVTYCECEKFKDSICRSKPLACSALFAGCARLQTEPGTVTDTNPEVAKHYATNFPARHMLTYRFADIEKPDFVSRLQTFRDGGAGREIIGRGIPFSMEKPLA